MVPLRREQKKHTLKVRPEVDAAFRRIAEEHRGMLDILEAYDRGESTSASPQRQPAPHSTTKAHPE